MKWCQCMALKGAALQNESVPSTTGTWCFRDAATYQLCSDIGPYDFDKTSLLL